MIKMGNLKLASGPIREAENKHLNVPHQKEANL